MPGEVLEFSRSTGRTTAACTIMNFTCGGPSNWRQIDILAEEMIRRSPTWTCSIIVAVLEQDCDALFRKKNVAVKNSLGEK